MGQPWAERNESMMQLLVERNKDSFKPSCFTVVQSDR